MNIFCQFRVFRLDIGKILGYKIFKGEGEAFKM